MMHITHGKAGSTWIDRLLRALFRKQVAPRYWEIPARFDLAKHAVHSAVFMRRETFLDHPELAEIRRFVVIRDLRDTLISQYFSMRDTHELDPNGIVQQRRDILRSCSFEEGLQWLLTNALVKQADIQRSWAGSGEIILKYEDLLADDLAMFRELFCDRLAIALSAERLEEAVRESRFETVYKRKLGEEDAKSHGRKGTPGDWKNHFTPDFARRFDAEYGALLIATGYEQDNSWVAAVA